MKRIIIDFISHKDQRYDTCGDWQFTEALYGTVLTIQVSETPDWRSSALVAVHELIEALLCKHAGITTEQVDAFDMNWKPHTIKNCFTGEPEQIEEPGDDPEAPYHEYHKFATIVEMDLCAYLEYSWEAHSLSVDELE